MSLWTRVVNVFRGDRLRRELDEERESHIEEAVRQGRDPLEARAAFGSALRQREESRDVKLVAWLDSLRADAVFGWRQLLKSKVTSAAAVLSLALAIGSCTSAFRLMDALLLRSLPIADADRLFAISFERTTDDGKIAIFDSCSYPMFREMRAAVKDQAELIAASYTDRTDLTYGRDDEMEKGYLQYVSTAMFDAFGLHPAQGRLFTANDDLPPGTHPFVVLSHDYLARRFGEDPKVIGRTLHVGNDIYEVAGVIDAGFTGIEPGTITDIFVPVTMRRAGVLDSVNSFWMRTLVRVKPGVPLELLQQKMNALYQAIEQNRTKGFVRFPKAGVREHPTTLHLESAAAGVSRMQQEYRRPLIAIAVLVGLVLLIACANVANLMTAQAASRAREMALRMSIGAGRWRLVQLVLTESAWIAVTAAAIGIVFAWWSAPLVVRMINPAHNPVRLVLSWDWRVLAFGVGLTLVVTFLFGLPPALRASATQPASALKGGEDPHSKRRLMHILIGAQVAFCFVVLFVSSLFTATFARLSHQPTGFSAERVVTLETLATQPQATTVWDEVAAALRGVPGVESVAIAGWPLMTGEMRNNYVSINGAQPDGVLTFLLAISPEWPDVMKIPLVDGQPFRSSDSHPGAAIVNETFVKHYFAGVSPVGKSFEIVEGTNGRQRVRIAGVVRDSVYRSLREPMLPVAYVPFQSAAKARSSFIVRTSDPDPLRIASILRHKVSEARSDFRVSNVRTQEEIVQAQTIRERLLAALTLFFAGVAMLLSAMGLFGVLDYSVLQRRREIGIRLAIGAPMANIARLVSAEVFMAVIAGTAAGLALGMTTVRYVESLFYQAKATDPAMLAIPSLIIFVVAVLAALPAILHAIRLDPAIMLRSE